MENTEKVKHYRTLFISDIHLGTKACQADAFLDFIKQHEADTYYLVGDIVDFWRIKRSVYWPQAHNDVIQKLLRKSRKGSKIIFIPGNHDEALRDYCGNNFGGIDLVENAVFEAADGKKYLVIHGDEFDIVVKYAKWLAFLGDSAYVAALWFNTHFNFFRRKAGMSYWSLSKYLKQKVKSAVNFIGEFEGALASEAKRRECQGVICGHIHHAAMKDIDGITYVNTGDWVESCTAVGENADGSLEIINWASRAHLRAIEADRQKELQEKAA